MKRRMFIGALAGGLLAAPLAAEAQPRRTSPRVGFLSTFSPSDVPRWREGLTKGLRDLGYTEGHDIGIEYRHAEGRVERLPSLAAELVRLKVDVIVAETTPASLAAKQASNAIPIVMTIVGDPVGAGLIASLGHPGGNITGMSLQLSDVAPKRLQLLREVVPKLSRVAILCNSDSPVTPPQLREVEVVAPTLGMTLESLPVRTPIDFESAIEEGPRRHANALLVLDDFLITRHIRQLGALTAKNRLPALAALVEFAEAGGLASYGPNYFDLSCRAAAYVDKILKGAKPADLPVEQPTKFELVINLKTAQVLGLTIPPSLLQRADQVIE
ncbi:MAG TPA: ABC transporter substrate-binding protein [Methylomirabilota bacterium]|nr:ABC transporter substrate-binding protein [Methylomirabilota bacterium]